MNTNEVLNKLKAEIERRKEKWLAASRLIKKGKDKAMYAAGKSSAYTEFFSLITSLQQEQPEVELNEETIINEFRVIRDKCFNEGIEGWQREKLIARHFYELGLKARKEE